MWDFIKTSLSLLGLFALIVVVLGLYVSLVGQPGETNTDGNQYQTIPGEATTTPTSTSSSAFIELNTNY